MQPASPTTIFSENNYVLRHGGRFLPTESSFPLLTSLFENCRNRATDWIDSATKGFRPKEPIPWIHFDFVDSTTLNAVAFRSKGHYFIGFNMGTPLLICDLFFRMLACSEVLPQIGNPANETAKPERSPTLYTDADFIKQYVTAEGIQHVFTMPKDPVRLQYAHLLGQIALDFLIAHEFAHILDAHILLSEEVSGHALVSETNRQDFKGVSPMFEQALELDADSFAVSEGFRKLFFHCDNPQHLPPEWQSFFKYPAEGLFTWFFSIYSFFRLFSPGKFEEDGLQSLSHPPPRVRQHLAETHLRLNVLHLRPQLLETYDRMVTYPGTSLQMRLPGLAAFESERAVACLTTGRMDLTGSAEALSVRGKDYVDAVIKQWGSMKPRAMELAQSL